MLRDGRHHARPKCRWQYIACASLCWSGCGGGQTPKDPSDPDVIESPQVAAETEEMTPDDVLFSLRHKESESRRCFEMVEGRLRGTARFSWTVGTEGRVSDVRLLDSTTGVPEVDACLEEFVGHLSYNRRERPARATWTFVHGLADQGVLSRADRREKRARRGSRAQDGDRFHGAVIEEGSRGQLDAARIEDIAEHGFRLYAFCMREGVNRDSALSGRVVLRFTIDPQGEVRQVADGGSDLPDLGVIDCVAQSFYAMRFPKPSGGSLRLRYSILLNEE